jgi:TolA-binding protein
MTQCDMEPEAAERYVGGGMAEPERTSFEEHFFSCDACFRAVQTLEDARQILADERHDADSDSTTRLRDGSPGRRGLPLRSMAIAATLVLSVLVWRVTRAPETPSPTPPVAVAPAATPPMTAPPPTPSPAAPSTESRLERWAAVTPPQYVSLTTRSGDATEPDPDARIFDDAMEHYAAGRYRQAADGLRPLADRAPAAAHVQFFLGISELMAGNIRQARGALQRSAEAEVSPYSDEAHFYLAKAALRAADLTTAARELGIAVEREAGPDGEAARLLAEVRRIQR